MLPTRWLRPPGPAPRRRRWNGGEPVASRGGAAAREDRAPAIGASRTTPPTRGRAQSSLAPNLRLRAARPWAASERTVDARIPSRWAVSSVVHSSSSVRTSTARCLGDRPRSASATTCLASAAAKSSAGSGGAAILRRLDLMRLARLRMTLNAVRYKVGLGVLEPADPFPPREEPQESFLHDLFG